tara:strand:+ start:153 stop:542 length:390 start_codon:yes stop_codon:yes gene_type:complete
MSITNLNELNHLRSAPLLDKSESEDILSQINIKIKDSDWITIGIMATNEQDAKKALNSIIQKYNFKFSKNFTELRASGNVFLKANQKSGEVYIRSENGLGEGILLTCQYNDLSIHSKTYGPFPLNLFRQ